MRTEADLTKQTQLKANENPSVAPKTRKCPTLGAPNLTKQTHRGPESRLLPERSPFPSPSLRVRTGALRTFLSVVLALLVLFLVAPLRAADPARVSEVVVKFDDGSQQKLAADTTPPTPPSPTPPSPTPPSPTTPAPTTPTPVPTDAPATLPSTQASDAARPFLGVNLESLRDYERQFMFVDAIKTSRAWGTPEKPYDHNGPVGDDGWPSGDAGIAAITEVKNINGVYKFSCTGRCDLSTPGSPAKVENLRYDAANNRTTADVVVKAAQDKQISLNLAFKNTDGGIKNIKLLRPNYLTDESMFTSEFLNSLRPFNAIRFMDYLKTNNSQIVKWDDRCKPTDAQYTAKGGPYECAIELGNKLNKDIWINVPALADDDFVTQLGALVREKLKPGIHCYVEYSNEVWNGQFKQFSQNFEAAKAEVAAGDQTLNDGGADKNANYWARKRIAKRLIEIKKLMGADDRIRMVLASQVGFSPPGGVLKMQLEYVEKYFGPPANYFYAIAGAPYFSPGKDETDPTGKKWYTQRTDCTVDTICTRLLARVGTSANDNVKAFHALARKYGLKSFGYEGGLDLQQFGSQFDVKLASQYDLRTGQAIEQYLNNWYTNGGDAMFYFTLSCKYSKNGYWGLTEDVRELLTAKYLAAVRVSTKLRSAPVAPGSTVAPK
jgi:hypothetical protein